MTPDQLAAQYNQGQNRGFSWSNLGASIGNTVTDAVDYIGGTLDANAANSMAIAQINQAKAQALTAEQARKAQMQKNITNLIFLAIIAVAVVALAKIFKK